jgi:hypothetical protein
MRKIKRIILWFLAIPVVLIAGMAWLLWGGISNPVGRKTIGEITPPVGFQRVEVGPESFGAYLREFPLQGRGSHMKYYDGSLAHGQYFGYAVLNLPMISENEQCCDAVQRMRSEYLFSKGRYSDIHFESFQNGTMQYRGGGDRKALYNYLRKVFGASNTSTLRHELKKKPFAEIAPGDVLVYEADGRHSVGHAVLVVDVAVNPRNGKKAIMVTQSSMPALTMHIVRDILHPVRSPWVTVDEENESIFISGIRFGKNDLRGWPETKTHKTN